MASSLRGADPSFASPAHRPPRRSKRQEPPHRECHALLRLRATPNLLSFAPRHPAKVGAREARNPPKRAAASVPSLRGLPPRSHPSDAARCAMPCALARPQKVDLPPPGWATPRAGGCCGSRARTFCACSFALVTPRTSTEGSRIKGPGAPWGETYKRSLRVLCQRGFSLLVARLSTPLAPLSRALLPLSPAPSHSRKKAKGG